MGVAVLVFFLFEYTMIFRKIFYYLDIGFLMIVFRFGFQTLEVNCFLLKSSCTVDMLDEGQAIFLPKLHIILAECGSDMDDAGTILGRNETGGIDFPSVLDSRKALVGGIIIKNRRISGSDQGLSFYFPITS